METIIASEGHVIILANESNVHKQIYASQVILGVNDSPDNYRQIIIEEADAMRAKDSKQDLTPRE